MKKVVSIVPGGATALDSQYNGLREVRRLHPDEECCVLIHDGVRPLLDRKTILGCIEAVEKYGK